MSLPADPTNVNKQKIAKRGKFFREEIKEKSISGFKIQLLTIRTKEKVQSPSKGRPKPVRWPSKSRNLPGMPKNSDTLQTKCRLNQWNAIVKSTKKALRSQMKC